MTHLRHITGETVGEMLTDDDTQTVIVTGKGGVGKSTVSSAIALGYAGQGKNVLGIDMDGSPSMSDALGVPADSVDLDHNELVHIPLRRIRGKISVALLSEMIPQVQPSQRASQKEYEKVIEQTADSMLPDKINRTISFAPIMRLALQSTHFGIPVETKNLAHIVQLAEIYAHRRHLVSDFGARKTYAQDIDSTDQVIFDTENTNNLVHLMNALQQLVDIIKDVAGRDRIGQFVANVVGKFYSVMGGYMKSSIARKPEVFADAASRLQSEIMGSRTKVICVTNPGLTEVVKTVRDVKRIIQAGRRVDAVLMNRWPADPVHRKEAVQAENALLERLNALEQDIAFQRIEIPGGLHIISPYAEDAASKQMQNLQKMAEVLGL